MRILGYSETDVVSILNMVDDCLEMIKSIKEEFGQLHVRSDNLSMQTSLTELYLKNIKEILNKGEE